MSTLTTHQRKAFIDAYSQVVLASWADETFVERLEANPRATLAEVSFELPAGARVVVVRHEVPSLGQAGSGDLDTQIELYETGLRTGRFIFHLPMAPQLDTTELDLDELASVAAGTEFCCCCCPMCSSCTI